MKEGLSDKTRCNPATGCCSSSTGIPRRKFIKLSTLGATALTLPLANNEWISQGSSGHLIPADKKLSQEWLKSLVTRGKPEIFTAANDELKYIGMPIGGICCGQLYISGSGRLWLWDIFQTNYKREDPAPDGWRLDQFSFGGLYAKPRTSIGSDVHAVNQGFAIRISDIYQSHTLNLDDLGFDQVDFRGEYPVAKVRYRKTGLPVEVKLTAFSPFIPLNVKDSSIPATVLRYHVENTGNQQVKIDLGGWLENKVCPELANQLATRQNEVVRSPEKTTVFMKAEGEGLDKMKGWGNMALSLIGENSNVKAFAELSSSELSSAIFNNANQSERVSASFDTSLIGGINTSFSLEPGESRDVDFLVSWYFPYYNERDPNGDQMNEIEDFENLSRYYKRSFASADHVADYVTLQFKRLTSLTLKWNETWYESSLPYWFLDRSFISMNCLASQTSHLFDNGRFWGWEGVDCCQGTCTHVWQYAQGMSRIFPSLERDLRERVDYGISFDENTGSISYRGEHSDRYAVDGQLGTIIRVYREHQMSSNHEFLKKLWPSVRHSMQFIIDQDEDNDGLLEGRQPHTLDAAWYGPMGWISGLFLAALKASRRMALEMGDQAFAKSCQHIFTKGQRKLVEKLYNGEYFIHLPPDHDSINTNNGCHIDQVLGQSFAHQVNLGNVIPSKETRSALKALWKYNFAPDAGQYALQHEEINGERIFAMPDESGLLMTTWPFGGNEKAVPGMADRKDDKIHWIGPGGYFDETMNGFEYQVASHMVWEGMLNEGLSIMKAVHERYGPKKRNPYDEIECSSHYSRSMASYGSYLAACGFHHHGPEGVIGFDPKITPENFKCAFTTAEGWGSFSQIQTQSEQTNRLELVYGQLRLNIFYIRPKSSVNRIKVMINHKEIQARGKPVNNVYEVTFDEQTLNSNDLLELTLHFN